MNLRRRFKHWLYGQCPGFKGVLPYYGEKIHFHPGSLIFDLACSQGIFEHDNLALLQAAARPHTWYFDIGANIGLMSAPLLGTEPTLRVLSVEASPRTAGYLTKTVQCSQNRDRWQLVAKAVGAVEGTIEFHASTETHGVFDGIKDTGRGLAAQKVTVPLTTLDHLWCETGKPQISVIKIDVEGGEADVLRGGLACLRSTRPVILLEWNARNLAAYHCAPNTLLELAVTLNYDLLSAPSLAPVTSPALLQLHMGVGETFLFVPRS